MGKKQALDSQKETKFIDLERAERNREFRKKVIIGDVLWSMHRKQGTQAYLIEAIAPYLRKGDRSLFGLV